MTPHHCEYAASLSAATGNKVDESGDMEPEV